MKWIYSFVAFGALLAWGTTNLILLILEANNPSIEKAVALAGASTITGFLIALNTDIKQFWFRKKPSDPDNKKEG